MIVRTTVLLMMGLTAISLGQAVDSPPTALRPVPADPVGQRVALGSYTASATNDAQVGAIAFDLGTIPAGQIFRVDTCGQATGATYLRVQDDQGTEHAAGAAGCQNGLAGTRLTVIAPSTRRFQLLAGCVGSTACSGTVTASSPIELYQRWAPVVFQDTFPSEYFLRGDYITSVNFDGDYVGKNNWENADSADASYKAHVYYSVVESETHYFVGYYFFHPQDRTPRQHENDLEGILLGIKKSGLYGDLIAMETIAHGPFYQYVTPGLGTTESPVGTAPDGLIVRIPDVGPNPATGTTGFMPYLMAGHPAVYIEPGGHGVHSCNRNAGDVNCVNNDGLVYAFTGGMADDPYAGDCDDGSTGHFDLLNACGYALVSLDDWGGSTVVADPAVTQGLWVLQNHICDTCTLFSFTNFRGDDGGGCGDDGTPLGCAKDAANMPWQWRDHAGVSQGDWLSDPARLFKIDFEGPEFTDGVWSHEYVRHPYFSHALEMNRTRVRDNGPGDSEFVTVRATSAGSTLLGFYHWQKLAPVIGTWYPWFYGADDAADENTWAQADLNRYFFTRQTQVRDPATGLSANGGASVNVDVIDTVGGSPVAAALLSPDDRSSGTCASGCIDGNCRAQVNDFTCGNGFEGPRGDVAFKLTRVRRPSPPPTAVAGLDQILECVSPAGAGTTLDARASSHPEGDTIAYHWSAPGIVFDDPSSPTPAATFPLGVTVVTLAVSDGTWEKRDTVAVRVADRTPPTLQIALSPAVLSPPQHQLVPIEATVTAVDRCDSVGPAIVLTGISSNEPDNGIGDGDTTDDIQDEEPGTFDRSFQLRAERSARGTGRVYTVIYRATDAHGNLTETSAEVHVPLATAELAVVLPVPPE